MMSGAQARAHLALLRLSQTEAARLLDTHARTVRRWVEDDDAAIPGPAAQVLHAWAQLHRAGLCWRPDHRAVPGEASHLQDTRRRLARGVAEALERVRRRGGPAALWDVDLERQRATLGTLQLHFQVLEDGGFVPQSYRPVDRTVPPASPELAASHDADASSIAEQLEDGYACVTRALARVQRAWRPAFSLAPAGVVGDRVLLWEDCAAPTLVVIVPGSVARAVMGPFVALSEVKEILDRHGAVLNALAQRLSEGGAGEVGGLGVRELVVDEAQMRGCGFGQALPGAAQGGLKAHAPAAEENVDLKQHAPDSALMPSIP